MIYFNNLPQELQEELSDLKIWLKNLVRQHGFIPGDIVYFFCNDEELLKVNQQFLQHDSYTDIITFDYADGKMLAGDIYISEQRVRENASTMSLSLLDELLRVVAHGVLHLCGYKDKTDLEAMEMRTQENMAINMYKKLKDR